MTENEILRYLNEDSGSELNDMETEEIQVYPMI